MVADFSYDAVVVVNSTTNLPIQNATGEFRATPTGPAQPIYDMNGTPIANLTTGQFGLNRRFRADIDQGFLAFGADPQPIYSLQVANSRAEATSAAASAAAAATSAAAARTVAETVNSAFATHNHALATLSDVSLTGRTGGAAIVWDATENKYVHDIIEGGSGITAETLATAPAGSTFIINYYDAVFSAVNSYPTNRPSTRQDIYFIWRGPTDPGTRVGAHDTLWLVQVA